MLGGRNQMFSIQSKARSTEPLGGACVERRRGARNGIRRSLGPDGHDSHSSCGVFL